MNDSLSPEEAVELAGRAIPFPWRYNPPGTDGDPSPNIEGPIPDPRYHDPPQPSYCVLFSSCWDYPEAMIEPTYRFIVAARTNWPRHCAELITARRKIEVYEKALRWINDVNSALPLTGELAVRTLLDIREKAKSALSQPET